MPGGTKIEHQTSSLTNIDIVRMSGSYIYIKEVVCSLCIYVKMFADSFKDSGSNFLQGDFLFRPG